MTRHHTPERSLPTFCRICEAACGLLADLDASGHLVRLRPDRQHPVSQGFACAKGTRFLEVAEHPERLLFPLRRRADGGYERVTWDEAMAFLAQRLRPILERYGPHAVGIYFGNPLAFNTLGLLTMLGFMHALGTRNVFSASSQDCHNKFAGAQIVHGSPFIHPLPDFEHTDVAMLWGTNPAVSQTSFMHLAGGSTVFDRLQQRGGKIIWIDPRYTESAQRWGEHIAIRPGTDIFLLLTLLHALRERYRPDPRVEGLDALLNLAAAYPVERAAALTGIAPNRIMALTDTIRAARRATLHMSVGVNQGPFGTLCYIVLQALAYLSGHVDGQGGVLFHPLAVWLAEIAQRCGFGATPGCSRVGQFPSIFNTLPAGILADEILTPGPEQIRALLVVAGDPLTSIPGEAKLRRALRQLECLVCVDLFQNGTGREADLILPTTSWLERWDIANTTVLFQHTPMIQYAPPVRTAPGAVRSEAHILAAMSLALGRPLCGSRALSRFWSWLACDTRLAALLTALLWPARLLFQGAWGLPAPRPRPGRYLGRGPRTPGHRMRFWHAELAAEPTRLAAYAAALSGSPVLLHQQDTVARVLDGDPDPLPPGATFTLICRRRRLGHNSWLHGAVHDGNAECVAWLAPAELLALGVPAGGELLLHTTSATLRVSAVPVRDVPPKTVVVPHGVPGMNVNALLPTGVEMLEPISGQHFMTGIVVRVTVVCQRTV
jgi:anaerobic selenocysteine-containing dehydrogenase